MQENEVITFILGITALIFFSYNTAQIKRIPHYKILFSSFLFILAGYLFTNLESLFWFTFFNVSEHICNTISAACLAAWVFKALYRKEGTS